MAARKVLVLAPHYDDEVLGCGGLVMELVAKGARVKVLFLSDGGAGEPDAEVEDRGAYSRRRKGEAEQAAKVLGITEIDHAGLLDGSLAHQRQELAEAITRALEELQPDLLLVPSPLETSADHRASFAALGDVLRPLRGDDELGSALAGMVILVYEVNHPAYPDLLVDVSAHLAKIEEAMGCYASQQERHDYLAAGLGLRRYRTLSLPSEVSAAEGYRRLEVKDFVTRSPAQLILHLGGVPALVEIREGPRISVVVRTRDRPELLAQALESLEASTYRRTEVVLVNDGGKPPEISESFSLPLVRVDLSQNRGRAEAAEAGVASASGDSIAFLDDDDLVAPEHLATLAGVMSGAEIHVVYSDAAVGVYEPDPAGGWRCRERRLPYSRDFDLDVLLLDNYIPFNTLLIRREWFAQVGAFDATLPFFEDWDFLIRLASLVPFHHVRQVTCEYRHFETGEHHILGGRARQHPDFLDMKGRVLAKHAAALDPGRLARAVDTLRAESVDQREETRRVLTEVDGLRQELLKAHQETARVWRQVGTLQEEKTTAEGELVAVRKDVLLARQETVAAQRDAEGAQKEAEDARRACQAEGRRYYDLEERYHRLNGKSEALKQEHQGLRQALQDNGRELERLYQEEKSLRAVVEDQGGHLEKTYAEIERLNRVIQGMAQTRAWRFSRWWRRMFS